MQFLYMSHGSEPVIPVICRIPGFYFILLRQAGLTRQPGRSDSEGG